MSDTDKEMTNKLHSSFHRPWFIDIPPKIGDNKEKAPKPSKVRQDKAKSS